jgi:predicted AlkP superfamily phosphohydrolase/phosphomutase
VSARVLVLGIDAGSAPLIEAWAAEGVLPNLRALMARGVVGRTESVEGFFVGSTWPSFYTGASPAEHGIHSLVQLRAGTCRPDIEQCPII